MNLTTVKEDQPVSDVFQLRVSAFAQGVFNGEVVHILLQGVIQGAHLAIFPQSIQHQGGKDLGYTGNPTEGATTQQILYSNVLKIRFLLFMEKSSYEKITSAFALVLEVQQ